ncbi:MAG: hypothetical protein JW929_14175 [Anaerolineales bacterium]|nr:hypothetical protein [Anaerolineales bacterium]
MIRPARLPEWRFPRFARRRAYRGQILILAVVIILLFFFAAVAMVDVYHVEEARMWGNRAAQLAAMAGVSGDYPALPSSKWTIYQPTTTPMLITPTPGGVGCMDPVRVELDPSLAYADAENMLVMEMEGVRGFAPGEYYYEIRVLPSYNGGTTVNWPPAEVIRLGGSGDWSTVYPAVGVYLRFEVATFMSSIVGQDSITLHVFGAAEVAQPAVCP